MCGRVQRRNGSGQKGMELRDYRHCRGPHQSISTKKENLGSDPLLRHDSPVANEMG